MFLSFNTHAHTDSVDLSVRGNRCGEHKAKFEDTRNTMRFDDVTSCACTARTRGDAPIPDAGALNCIKWDIQSEVAGLRPALTKSNGTGNMEPLRLAVWWKVARHPSTCADRDLMVIFCGKAAAEHAVAVGTIDQVNGHDHLFNPRRSDMSCQEALNEHQTSGCDEGHNPSAHVKHCHAPTGELDNFQKNVRNLVVVPEHPVSQSVRSVRVSFVK